MAKQRTKVQGKKKATKPPTVAQAKEALPALVNSWGGNEFAAGKLQHVANALLGGLVTMLRKANYVVASVRGKGEKVSAGNKAKAKFLAGLVHSSITAEAQRDVVWVASFDGRKGDNSWKHAARLRGDSPSRITSIATNCKKPSEMLGKIEGRIAKEIAKEQAIKEGKPTNVKKTPLDILFGKLETVYDKLNKADASYPEEFNEHRRKSMAVELKELMVEVEELIAHTQKSGD